MYNEDIKTQFIISITPSIESRKRHKNLFDRIQPLEEKAGKDICQMNTDELQSIVDILVGIRQKTMGQIRLVRDYLAWCVERGISGSKNCFAEIKIDNVEVMKNKTVTGPRQLQVFLDAVFKPECELGVDNLFRLYYWLAFAGIPENDYINLRTNQIDLQNLTIIHNGRNYPLYREALPCVRNCIESPYFRRLNPKSHQVSNYSRIESDMLFRGIRTVPNASTVFGSIKKAKKEARERGSTTKELSYRSVVYSGIFYRMYEDDCAGLPIDSLFAADIWLDNAGSESRDDNRKRVARELLQDYDIWKLTFNK